MRINFLQTLPNYSLIKLVCVLEVLIVIFLCLIYYGNLGEYLSRGPDKYGAISKTVVKNTNINSKIIQPISPKVSTLKGKTKKKDKKKKHKKKKMAFKPTIEQLRLYQNVSIPIKPKMECKSYHEQRGISHKRLWDWAPVRIFIGVWSTAGKYELRNFIRNLYLRQQRNVIGDKIDFKFIIGTPTNYTDELKLQLAAENTTHGDLIMLNIKENMDNGKAYHYWTWVWNNLNTMGYNYVAKADDDTFVHFQNLALNLRPLPRHYVYYGFVRPHLTRYLFVQGMIETLSIGHAKKIATTPYVKKEWDGPEDRMLATWLGNHVNSTLRVINEDCLLLNDPRIPTYYPVWRRWASPHSIAIHWLKEISAWKSVVDSYFPDK